LQRHWFGKTLAGLLFGIWLGVAAAAWLVPPGHVSLMDLHVQMAMWCVVPVWVLIQSTVYLFRSGRHAWLCLGMLALPSFIILFASGRLSFG
jgi:hypothetical protein